ncbi:MAG: DUF3352 domain-containing protein, partial [Anaerolineales bacterium]|nr:DUF3352 domain-containing protein [Anaerolineales bacterium]
FGWNLLGLRRAEGAARAIPADVGFYMSLDLGNITCEDLNPIVWAFSREYKEKGKCALDEYFSNLDTSMEENWGLTFTDDVKPWLGRSIALGWRDLTLNPFGGIEDVEIIFSFEVRNQEAVDEFLSKMMAAVSEESGEQFLDEIYQGATLYSVDAPSAIDQFTFARSDDLLIFGVGKSDVKAAIDAQRGESLADSSAFRESIAELPRGRLLTIYLDSEHILGHLSPLFEDLADANTFEAIRESIGPKHYEAAGLYIVDAGIRVDLAFVLDPANRTEETLSAYQSAGKPPHTDSLMPEGSFVYRAGSGINQGADDLQENLARMQGEEDFTEAMMFFTMAFGFDPFEDFLSKLDGEWAFGIVPSTEGILYEELEIPVGFVFLSETSDPEGLKQVSEGFGLVLEQLTVGTAEPTISEGATFYDVFSIVDERHILTYGVEEGYFMVGSSASALSELFTGGPSLADSERYSQIWQEFPKGMAPVMYIDIRGLAALIQEKIPPLVQESVDPDAEREAYPVTYFAVAGTPMENGVAKATMILFIETD